MHYAELHKKNKGEFSVHIALDLPEAAISPVEMSNFKCQIVRDSNAIVERCLAVRVRNACDGKPMESNVEQLDTANGRCKTGNESVKPTNSSVNRMLHK